MAARSDGEVIHIEDGLAGKSLPQVMRAAHADWSWGAVAKLIDGRRVTINGNLCMDAGRRLKAGEVVKVLTYAAAEPPKESDVRVRYLDAHIVVVEKPAGMTTLRHPEERDWPRRRKQLQPTLDEVLPAIVEKKSGRGSKSGRASQGQKGPPRRLRPVHRLDRETSGLMVFARTIQAESALGKQFRAHSLQRHYIAVCHGKARATTYETHLVEDRGDGRRGGTHFPNQGKRAVTHVKPLERLGEYTAIQCRLETGRTHQIRIHLAEAGHPICGDKVYRGPFPGTPIADESGASRVALHAADLAFVHPITGEVLRFNMPIPFDMVDLIDRLRGRPGRPPEIEAEPFEPPLLPEFLVGGNSDDEAEPAEEEDEPDQRPRSRRGQTFAGKPQSGKPQSDKPPRGKAQPVSSDDGDEPQPAKPAGRRPTGGKLAWAGKKQERRGAAKDAAGKTDSRKGRRGAARGEAAPPRKLGKAAARKAMAGQRGGVGKAAAKRKRK
jgi:23S rRNA pseudouridine1911/1915/1917 synthase